MIQNNEYYSLLIREYASYSLDNKLNELSYDIESLNKIKELKHDAFNINDFKISAYLRQLEKDILNNI